MGELVGEDRLHLGLVRGAALSPVVAQTTALLGLRPVAKALGTSVSAIATLGFCMSARAHRRSTAPWSAGGLLGGHQPAVHPQECDLS